MREKSEHIASLRYLSALLRERQSWGWLKDEERQLCRESIVALDRAVEALEMQVQA